MIDKHTHTCTTTITTTVNINFFVDMVMAGLIRSITFTIVSFQFANYFKVMEAVV